MSTTKTKTTFKALARLHREKFNGFDVWKTQIQSVVLGVSTQSIKYSVTKKVKKANLHYNVVLLENELVSDFDTMDEAMAEAERLVSKTR